MLEMKRFVKSRNVVTLAKGGLPPPQDRGHASAVLGRGDLLCNPFARNGVLQTWVGIDLALETCCKEVTWRGNEWEGGERLNEKVQSRGGIDIG
jgi:hypothetical protein